MRAGFRRAHQQQRETPLRALLQPSAAMHRAAGTAALHVSETLSSEQHACVCPWRSAVVMVSALATGTL